MKLGRDELERSVAQFRMPEPAMDRLVARRRRHARRDRAAAAIAAIVVLALALAVLGRSFITTQPATRNDRPAPPWRTADVDGMIFTNPGDWHLTGYFNGTAQSAALGSYAPNLSGSDPCEGMPNDGAILVIDPQASGRAPAWPTGLSDGPSLQSSRAGPSISGRGGPRTARRTRPSHRSAMPWPPRRELRSCMPSPASLSPEPTALSVDSCFVRDGYPTLLGEVIAGTRRVTCHGPSISWAWDQDVFLTVASHS